MPLCSLLARAAKSALVSRKLPARQALVWPGASGGRQKPLFSLRLLHSALCALRFARAS